MKRPELYSVRKILLKDIIKGNFKLNPNVSENKKSMVKQQYNQIFRHILKLTECKDNTILDLIFVDCKGYRDNEEGLKIIIDSGFYVNDKKFKFYGKSASMGRNGILGFLSEDMYDKINKIMMMDLEIDKTVISKFEAYKHLPFSSCVPIEGELPYIVVIDDLDRTIKDVKIKYVDEEMCNYVDKKDGSHKQYTNKVIKSGIKDINLCVTDGCGLISLELCEKFKEELEIEGQAPTSYIIRMPYIKGLCVGVDYKGYFKENNIKEIIDIFGKPHDPQQVDMILFKSLYKGYGYFKKSGDYSDWESYIERFYKYDHCMGLAKWNFSVREEKKMTRMNYQILQDLDINKESLFEMAQYTKDWIENIVLGDKLYKYLFLGKFESDKIEEEQCDYIKAAMLHPSFFYDDKVSEYIKNLLKKKIDQMKIGKLWTNGAFKFIIPDVIMMMQHVGKMNTIGCLKAGEFYSKNHVGEYIINRNPHITSSEHVILNAINSDTTRKWLKHLDNVCMINSYDVTAPQLNGADFDGDLVLVHNNEIFKSGIKRDAYIVLDVDDKITVDTVEYNQDNLRNFTMLSLDSRIGEISNIATAYHNKKPSNDDTKKRYNDIVDLLSVTNGKEIDYSKTGVRWSISKNISQFAKPLPYFLKYKYDYLKKFSKSRSLMNELAWHIEKWERELNAEAKKSREGLAYRKEQQQIAINLMIDSDIQIDGNKYEKVKKIFEEYCVETKEINEERNMAKNYNSHPEAKTYFSYVVETDGEKMVKTPTFYEVNNIDYGWDEIYSRYENRIKEILPLDEEIATYLTQLCYVDMKNKSKTFVWTIGRAGIIKNIKKNAAPNNFIIENANSKEAGSVEYLGKYFKLKEIDNV